MRAHRRYALRLTEPRQALVDALGRRLPKVGLQGVLDDLDRTGAPSAVPAEAAGHGFTWDEHDVHDAAWWPQGVACLRGADIVLVGWYAKRRRLRTQGARISVVDRTDPQRPRYRHVLLVAPRRRLGLLSLGPVPVHAGGIAVLGELLYVADTHAGVRVFRLDDAVHVPRRRLDAALPWRTAGSGTLGRRPTGGFTAYGFAYALPQLLRLRVPRAPLGAGLRYSFLSVGDVDGQLSLVVGEYGNQRPTQRLVRYPLDPATGLPAFDGHGRCLPLEVHSGQPQRMQGVAVHGSTWYVSASAGATTPGDLRVGAPGAFRHHVGVLPPGPEDLDWARPGEQLWSLSEYPGRRSVFPIDVRRWH